MFAIEYAALFDVLNVGIARLGLPLALGGTSNHFRRAVLQEAGGWDAWNVTEDADLGLRLARLGYRVGCLDSKTLEAAPESIAVWMKQRRRWMKGWMQTLLVFARDASSVSQGLGWFGSVAAVLLLVNMVIGPLGLPVFCGFVVYNLGTYGFPAPQTAAELLETTLAGSVFVMGFVSTLWCAAVGMRMRGVTRFLPSLPLFLPYQLMISAAALLAFYDLAVRPYHWHKTPHARQVPEVPELKV